MKVVITNLKDYCREVQFFRRNQWMTIAPNSTLVFDEVDRNDSLKINYYKSLEPAGFKVCFVDEDRKCKCNEVSIKKTISLSDLSDDQLKRIIQNLGISTRLRARWKLESLINDNMPRDADLSDYL